MRAFHSDHFVLPLPPGHSFPMTKYRLLREAAEASLPGVRVTEAPPASDGELALAHDPAWITAVVAGHAPARPSSARSASPGASAWSSARGARWARRSLLRARRCSTARAWPPTWPAARTTPTPHKGSGYCVFNDVAVAARLMQAEWHRRHRRLLRVLVIDLDVHQGNGTAAIFRDDPTVFTLSLHGAKNFPFRKEASDLDVELPDGCSDDALPAGAGRGAGPGLGAPRRRRRPGWPSTWPVPTRTKTTAWAG